MAASYEDRLRRVIDYVYDHAGEDLSLDTLADVAAMSRFHWHRVFRAMTGETCAQAVRRIRLQRAGFLLAQGEAIDAVAARCGLGGRAAFTRAFTAAYGVSPARFRGRCEGRAVLLLSDRKEHPMYDVKIETTPPLRAAVMPHQGAYTQIARAFEQFSAIMTARGLWPHVRGMIGAYHDDPNDVPEAELRSHAGALVAPGMELPEGLEEIVIPGGKLAKLRVEGPYSGLQAAYDYFYGTWLPGSGEEPRDGAGAMAFEFYINSPMDAAPDELLTDICVPLK
ncbi:MAG: AraC family transcriptional regulator [Pseudomonadota bacterium]